MGGTIEGKERRLLCVAAALGGGQELFSTSLPVRCLVTCHFVQLSEGKSARNFRHGAEGFWEYGQNAGFCPVFFLPAPAAGYRHFVIFCLVSVSLQN